MEEAMICTAEDNYGMDGKVNLPNFTEDIDWHGLESLYSVNDSAFEHRSNYKLILDDWTNYLKDVDRMFALLNNFYERNETDGNIDIRNDESSGAMPASFAWALAEFYEESSGMAAEKRQPKQPVDIGTRDSSMVKPSPERRKLNNNIPEPGLLNSAHWRNNQAQIWTGSHVFETPAVDFSGNGLTEQEARHNSLLHPSGTLENELLVNSDESGDIFEDQMYLPINLAKSNDRETLNQSVIHQSSDLLKMNTSMRTNNDNNSRETVENSNTEGSASSSLSFN